MLPLFSRRITRSDLWLWGVYWALALLVILPSYVLQFGWGRAVGGMAYNVALDTAAVWALAFWLLPRLVEPGRVASSLLLAGAGLLLSGVLYQAGYALLLGYGHRAWTLRFLLQGIIAHGQSYGVLGALFIGKRYFEGQRNLLLAQKAQAESQLKALRAQVDPHFLFNNLNILDALIQQNPPEASYFLRCFASLYRYLIRHKDADLVPLTEELRFAAEYVYLLGHRFGRAYAFERTGLPDDAPALAGCWVVPGTLQVLLENVVKHNCGDEDDPLRVAIDLAPDALRVGHRRAPKRTPVDSTGTGLANLRERYRLLAGRELLVQATADSFAVTVPVLAVAPAPPLP